MASQQLVRSTRTYSTLDKKIVCTLKGFLVFVMQYYASGETTAFHYHYKYTTLLKNFIYAPSMLNGIKLLYYIWVYIKKIFFNFQKGPKTEQHGPDQYFTKSHLQKYVLKSFKTYTFHYHLFYFYYYIFTIIKLNLFIFIVLFIIFLYQFSIIFYTSNNNT